MWLEAEAAVRVVRATGLEVVELADRDLRNENTPNVTPSITVRVKRDDFCRFCIFNCIVEEQSHFAGVATEDYKLNPMVMDDRTIG
jgi:hypothetical protein